MPPSIDRRSARARRNTILRRGRGLAKKARELSVLSDSRLCLILTSPDDMAMAPMSWPESNAEVQEVIRRYRQLSADKNKGKNQIQEDAALPSAVNPAEALHVPYAERRRRLHIPRQLKLPCPDSRHELSALIDFLDEKLPEMRNRIDSLPPRPPPPPSSSTSSSTSGSHGGRVEPPTTSGFPFQAPTPIRWMLPADGLRGDLVRVEAPVPIRWLPPGERLPSRVIGGAEAMHACQYAAHVD